MFNGDKPIKTYQQNWSKKFPHTTTAFVSQKKKKKKKNCSKKNVVKINFVLALL